MICTSGNIKCINFSLNNTDFKEDAWRKKVYNFVAEYKSSKDTGSGNLGPDAVLAEINNLPNSCQKSHESPPNQDPKSPEVMTKDASQAIGKLQDEGMYICLKILL